MNRAAYRTKCRKKLAEYLRKIYRLKEKQKVLIILPEYKLGLSIKPEDIRLMTNADDPYSYAYRALCRKITPDSQPSFTIRIQQLESEKLQLATELDQLISQVTEAPVDEFRNRLKLELDLYK
ncbi:hypothetical protein OEA41_008799 [Lepraria neglecta]|uniref:Uncharacterized protein n=1 Tax=Lepraria neglecta TaxID=209136 RepID=A0AAD9Z241_9LECA|nr:hypothetical protein OEA41_008799 [Lepraria neglecta]